LVTAATSANNITLVGDRAISRSTDFVTGGDLFANSLNDEFDSLVIFSQQTDEKAERGLKAPVTDPTDINMVLPSKTSRAGKTLAFDSLGNPTVGEDIGNWRGNWRQAHRIWCVTWSKIPATVMCIVPILLTHLLEQHLFQVIQM